MCMNSLRLFQTSYGSGGFLRAWRIKTLLFRIADFPILIFTFRDDKTQPHNDPLSCLSSVFINLQTRQPIKCMEEETMAPNQMCAFTRWSKTNCTWRERSCFTEIKLKWIKQHSKKKRRCSEWKMLLEIKKKKKERFLPTVNVPRKVAGKLLTGLVSRHVKKYRPLRSSP